MSERNHERTGDHHWEGQNRLSPQVEGSQAPHVAFWCATHARMWNNHNGPQKRQETAIKPREEGRKERHTAKHWVRAVDPPGDQERTETRMESCHQGRLQLA